MDKVNNKTRLYADLGLVIVAILWGTTFVISKIALSYATPIYITAIRFLLAFVIMAIVFRKKVFNMKKSDLKGGAIVGVIFYVAFLTQMIALQYTTAGKQAFLAGTYVVMAPFLYWLISRKRPDMRSFIGAAVCFIGIGLLTLDTTTFSISFGDGLTLFSSLFFAGHIISTGYFVQKQDAVTLTVVQFGVVGILSLISALIFEPFPNGIALNGILSIVYLSIFCTFIAYFLQTIAQKYTISTHASIILSLESVFGSIFSVIVLGEIFTFKMVIGCIAIFGAILIAELK